VGGAAGREGGRWAVRVPVRAVSFFFFFFFFFSLCCEDFRAMRADTRLGIIYSIYILIGLRAIVGRWKTLSS